MAPSASSAFSASKPCLHQGSLVAQGSTIAVFTLSWPSSAWAPAPPPPPSSSSSSPQAMAPSARTTVTRKMGTAFQGVVFITTSISGYYGQGQGPRPRSLYAHPLPEGDSKRGRLDVAPRPDRGRDHHDQGDRIRQRSEDLRGHGRGDSPADRLDSDLQGVREAKQERTANHQQRVPAPEDHERDGDPPAASADVVLEEVELAEDQYGAAHARHAATDQQGEPARAHHRNRGGVRRSRSLADGAHREPEAGAREQQRHGRDEDNRHVEERVLLEQDRADAGDLGQQRDVDVG